MTTRHLVTARIVKFWLDLVLVLGTAGAAVLTLFLLFGPLLADDSAPPFDVAIPVAIGERPIKPVLPLTAGDQGAVVAESPRIVDGYGELRFRTSTLRVHLLQTSLIVLGLLLVLWVVYLLRAIFKSVLGGTPFDPANAARLRWIGALILAGGFLAPLAQYVMTASILRHVSVEGLPLSPPLLFKLDIVLAGLMILVLSAVFDHGARLEQDQSLTV